MDAELGKRVDESLGRVTFIKHFIEKPPLDPARAALGPWQAFVMGQVQRALDERDLTAFVQGLQREPMVA